MTNRYDYRYDLFISCSEADEDWVEDELLPRLEAEGLRVAVGFRDFPVGPPRLVNIERAIRDSLRTLVVLTPEWLANEWNVFEGMLVRTDDPAARRRKLLPVLLKPCEPPEAIRSLDMVNLTDRRRWERKMRRLVWSVWAEIPESLPWKAPEPADLALWQRWLKRNRRPLGTAFVSVVGLWLLVSMLLQVPPFQPRLVWTSLGLHAPGAQVLVRSGGVLLVGGANPEAGCEHQETGLWRSADNGATWQVVAAPLCFERPGQGDLLADVAALAPAPALPQRVYAATSDVGLLRSDDAGQTWRRTGGAGLGSLQLTHAAVDPADADRVYVATAGGGLYRSDDGGASWQRLDLRTTAETCRPGAVLSRTLSVGALLVTADRLLVGTGDPAEMTEFHVSGGLYASTDGGTCWQPLAQTADRYQYFRLVSPPGSPPGSLLVLAHDGWVEPGADMPEIVWRFDLSASPPGRQVLWKHGHKVVDVGAVAGAEPTWYAVTGLGRVVRGPLAVVAEPEELPRLTRCFLGCLESSLAPDAEEGPPLLLVADRVYRLAEGRWWRRLWP